MDEGDGRLLGGRYRLRSVLGRGGMGIVWRAVDEVLGRDVAVKEVLVPRGLEDDAREVLHKRMLREARAAARLSHPGIVTVHDVVEVDGSPWIVMEFVEARTLQDTVDEDGPLPPGQVAEIGRQLLGALRTAHLAGILHRDVKPANVMLSDERAVLTDFGIAHMEGDVSLTQTGIVMGSPAYIAPERAQGDRPGPPADLWALGATLYMAVEGNPPHDREDILSTLAAVMMEDVPEPKRAGPLAPLLLGLLVKDPTTRLDAAGAAELLQRTESYEGSPVYAEITSVDAHRIAAATEALPSNVIPAAPVGPAFDSLYAPTPRQQLAPAVRPAPQNQSTFPAAQRPSSDEAWIQHLDRGIPPHAVRKRGLGVSAVIGAMIGVLAVVILVVVLRPGLIGGGSPNTVASSTSTGVTEPAAGLKRQKLPGFTIDVPDGWPRQTDPHGYQWNDRGTAGFVQMDTISWTGTPYVALSEWLKVVTANNTFNNYVQVDFKEVNVVKGAAADLEFTYTAKKSDLAMHGIDRRIRTDSGVYALFISIPAKNWSAMQTTVHNVLESFRPS
jgi:serine/threonine protein kinase